MKNPNMVLGKSISPSLNVSVEHPGESSKSREKSSATRKPHATERKEKGIEQASYFWGAAGTANDAFMEKFNITGL